MDYESSVAPHPSYQLEDSSEGSDWEQDDSPKMKQLSPEPTISLVGNKDRINKGGQVVFLIGEAGERLAQGIEVKAEELIKVVIDGAQCGAIAIPSEEGRATLVFLSTSIPLSSLHPLASFLLEILSPTSTTILASYHLPSYIPSSSSQESPTAFASRLPILYLSSPSSSPTPLSNSSVEPYLPPNLLHGLPSAIFTLSTLLCEPSTSTFLLLLPTSTPPQPLNGPFSNVSPISHPTVTTLYDSGGPVGLSDPGAMYRELAGRGGKLSKIKEDFKWDWWTPLEREKVQSKQVGGKGFEWLEKERKQRKREEASSMFM